MTRYDRYLGYLYVLKRFTVDRADQWFGRA